MLNWKPDHVRRAILLQTLCGIFLGSAVAWAASQPIYTEHANARRDIAAAISQASKTGRNIALIFGANW